MVLGVNANSAGKYSVSWMHITDEEVKGLPYNNDGLVSPMLLVLRPLR